MKAITKNPEPASLTKHREMAHADYQNYIAKDDLRQALVNEQRGLCCYCMGRICAQPAKMKIEHWRSQAGYPDEQLDYRNLLGACLGGQGERARSQHCDTRKGDSHLDWNPADPAHRIETRIRYEPIGSIHSDEVDFDHQLNDVLNLNLAVLVERRKKLLDAVLEWWERETVRIGGPVPRDLMVQKRNRYVGGAGSFLPYCQVAVWWLEQKLRRMAA